MFTLALNGLIIFLLLAVPGTLVLLYCGLAPLLALALSPAFSIVAYVLGGIVLHAAGLNGAGWLLGFVVVATLLICLSISTFNQHRLSQTGYVQADDGAGHLSAGTDAARMGKFPLQLRPYRAISFELDPKTTGLYVLVGVIAMFVLVVLNVRSIDAVNQFADNVYHLDLIKAMSLGGNFSTIASSRYLGLLPVNQSPYVGTSYYPAAFHIFCALDCLISKTSPARAELACNLVFIALVYPLGFAAFLQLVFRDRPAIARYGSLVTVAGVQFPLRFFEVHGAYPNLIALCLVPALFAMMLVAFDTRGSRLVSHRGLTLYFVAVLGVAFAHPNAAIFGLLVFAVFFAFSFLPHLIAATGPHKISDRAILVLAVLGWSLICLCIWTLVLNLPAMRSIVNFKWNYYSNWPKLLANVFDFALYLGFPQYLLAALCIIGLAATLSQKETRWLGLTYLLFVFIYVFGACMGPTLKRFLTGFWYTDYERIGALLTIIAVPLTAVGLTALVAFFTRLISLVLPAGSSDTGRSGNHAAGRQTMPAATAVILSAFIFINFYPIYPISGSEVYTAFSQTCFEIRNTYTPDPEATGGYSTREQAFIAKVKQTVPKNALILNMPYDGSVFSWTLDDLNVYYKSYNGPRETQASKTIRKRLCKIAGDNEVQRAVLETGARYLLILDRSDFATSKRGMQSPTALYQTAAWKGFEITDDTPGFTPVLQDGDMRLYKIDVTK